MNPREDIVSFLRGFFMCPILSKLGKRGILKIFELEKFNLDSFKELQRKDLMIHIFDYFESLDLITKLDDFGNYTSTPSGRSIFKRWGSFTLLYSYRDLVESLDELLFEPNKNIAHCDRRDNVIGSGITNSRKFFPAGLEFIKNKKIDVAIDLCCGDGSYLIKLAEEHSEATIIASDLSSIAINEAMNNFNKLIPNAQSDFVETDALEIDNWVKVVKKNQTSNGITVISMWYLIHEFSDHNIDKVATYLSKIHDQLHNAHIIIGEIVSHSPSVLSVNYRKSIMPEFQLFHEYSGQGILTWDQFNKLKNRIPYELASEKKFDIIEHDGNTYPTGIVWHLVPK